MIRKSPVQPPAASAHSSAQLQHVQDTLETVAAAGDSAREAVEHARALADILGQLHVDEDVALSAMLYPLLLAKAIEAPAAEGAFGRTALDIGRELVALGTFGLNPQRQAAPSVSPAQAEALRKMLLAIVTDPRLVLIRLADQLYRLRSARLLDEDERCRLAVETREIYAPLANRLGIWQLKWELEDLSFRYLDPDNYQRIAAWLAEKRTSREQYIAAVIDKIRSVLHEAGIEAEVAGRPKHIYSIWRKMQRKEMTFEQLYDIRAIRVIVATVADCYAALGLVHGLWPYLPGEFDDYIATPKENLYRSLHTAVIGPGNMPVEIQIRTREMHEHSELGVAAHWRYKEGGKGNVAYEQKIKQLRRLLAPAEILDDSAARSPAQDLPVTSASTPTQTAATSASATSADTSMTGPGPANDGARAKSHASNSRTATVRSRDLGEGDFLERVRSEIFEDRVYVLSPKGEVIELPKGATPLDFAYHVHTNLGHRCRGAKVNGRMVGLTHPLQNGDEVEIVTGKQLSPSRDWLVPSLGYLASARNRGKVRAWFRKLDEDQNRTLGKQMLERELQRAQNHGAAAITLPELIGEFHFESADQLYLAMGEGDVTPAQIAGAILRHVKPQETQLPSLRRLDKANTKKTPETASGVTVDGVGDLMSNFARCCRPVPPEPISGYITLGRGVSIHRADCANMRRLRAAHPERVIAVEWGGGNARTFPVEVSIKAFDRRGLVRDISAVLADSKMDIQGMSTVTHERDRVADMVVRVTVHDVEELTRVLTRLQSVPNVISARRRGGI